VRSHDERVRLRVPLRASEPDRAGHPLRVEARSPRW
jgi:hypothetical protein